MADDDVRHASYSVHIPASADTVYRLLADATAAPLLFPATVHVEILEQSPGAERLRLWALTGGDARSWTARRRLDPIGRSVTFQQEVMAPPVAFMEGRWLVEPAGADRSRVVLAHGFAAAEGVPDAAEWIATMVERISTDQLHALKSFAGFGRPERNATEPLYFMDSITLDCPPREAFDLVRSIEVGGRFEAAGSDLILAERSPDGGEVTRSAVLCFPDLRIAVKALTPPPPVGAHTWMWRFEHTPGGSLVTVRHVAVPRSVEGAADPAAGDTDRYPAAYLREALGAPGRAVLAQLADHSRGS